jgi:hypothetical protein
MSEIESPFSLASCWCDTRVIGRAYFPPFSVVLFGGTAKQSTSIPLLPKRKTWRDKRESWDHDSRE